MKYELVGLENVDYVSRKSGERVEGVKLHVVGEEGSSNRVKGHPVESFWISKRADIYEKALSIPLNSNIECSYNRWGNLDHIEVVKG